ncbi:hypothetical protein SDC9_175488 [bioreactor metagenome]|uniref:Uncharacterized protein n=1 Tax=bioreactor metagenome TaxID=1076179 RepID=A0A645GQ71_9ZZZZ
MFLRFSAQAICPACPRSRWTRGSNAFVMQPCASQVSDAMISAFLLNCIASWTQSAPIAVITCVPLISASPSFAASCTGSIPARRIASAPGKISPRYSACPKPMSGSTICASGTRSPLAPRLPFSGIIGCTPAFSIASNVSIVERRMPEKPLASALRRRSITPRTASVGRGSPVPQAWLMIRLRWSFAASSSAMRFSENLPKPVVRP